MQPRKSDRADADRFHAREGTSRRGLWRLRQRIRRGRRAWHAWRRTDNGTWESQAGLRKMSSASKERTPSERKAGLAVGFAHSTEEAGQRPWREGAEQRTLPGQGATAAPEADDAVSTKLAGLVARARKEERLTNVISFVDEGVLRLAFGSLRKQAAPGVDGRSYEDYAERLSQNVAGLYARLRSGRYQAPAVRRVYIPKATGGQRPLGIPTIEDRMVQKAVAWVLGAVYEQDFCECSHGFRPGRSAHTALHRLREGIRGHRVKAIVEVDVVGFFDHVNHAWLKKFVQHRVNDGGLLRLLGKWLRAGVMDHGVVTRSEAGTPQGGPVSPMLANIYLHYALDLWFEKRFVRRCRGWAELTRYADDFVAAFEDQADAERYRQEVEERLEGFGLQVAVAKTAIVPFDWRGLRQPGRSSVKAGSFTFLGLTLFRMKSRNGWVTVGWKPSVQARERFLQKVKAWLACNRHRRVWEQRQHLGRMLTGFYQYFGLRMCSSRLGGTQRRVARLWQQSLRRRSQRARRRCAWPDLNRKAWFQLPTPRIMHVWV